jgi:hypothetical protein
MNFPKIINGSNFLLLGLGRDRVPTNNTYKAVIHSDKSRYILGNIVRLDARGSTTSPNTEPKYYFWQLKSVPIGSQCQRFGLIQQDDRAQFTPDRTGIYTIELVVGDDSGNSMPASINIGVSIIVDSSGQQIIPDTSYIWNLLGDFFTKFD